MRDLHRGDDFRDPQFRREVFLRFYEFHLRYRSHPGCVYYLLPYLRWKFGWDHEAAMWFAFVNGNTQHPVTSLRIVTQFPEIPANDADASALRHWFFKNYASLPFDTDRRHHKRSFPDVVDAYYPLTLGSQWRHWSIASSGGFDEVWRDATRIPTFGRLSAFSFVEYLRIAGVDVDCENLMLADRAGSRSHRNGLAIVCGRDELDWHESNPSFDGCYPAETLEWMNAEAESLRLEMRIRLAGTAVVDDVSYLTLESALCTYKSWHRPNRRYPNVYNDMLYDRIRATEKLAPEVDTSIFWQARAESLPPYLRLEDSPNDPGCVPIKQNWYRETGEVIMMDRDWPCFGNGFNDAVDGGAFPRCR